MIKNYGFFSLRVTFAVRREEGTYNIFSTSSTIINKTNLLRRYSKTESHLYRVPQIRV